MSIVLALTGTVGLALWIARIPWFGTRRHPRPKHARPVIILGARVFPDGSATAALAGRVATAVSLYRAGQASRLVFSGGSPDGRPTEASVMRRMAVEAGVEPAHCLLEESSLSTRENARFCAELLGREPEILLVTCDFHLLRATRLFRARGFTVFPVASRHDFTPWEWCQLSVKEAVAMVWSR
jgi:uncharacterized SAM-binding protein YcdF (DUF218 family)